MRLLRLVLSISLAGLLIGCGPKEDDAASNNAKKTGADLQASENDPANKRNTKPKETPNPAVDPPAVDPPAVDPPAIPDRILDRKKAQKLEVRHSMLGFRNTLLFYTFKDEKAILTLSIGNTDETFPVKGKIHLFDDATTEEGLKKWINNQHSDGLFPDIPTPAFTRELPEGSCTVTSHKQTDTSENPSPISPATFKNYEVRLSVKEQVFDKKAKLSAFTDTALVHVKSEAGEVTAGAKAIEVEAEPVTQPEDGINVDLLARAWTHSREEDTNFEGKVFRPTNSRKFPPSRFRKRYVFNKDGSGEFLYLDPADRHRMVACQWKVTEDDPRRIIITGMIGGIERGESIEVLELTEDILRIKSHIVPAAEPKTHALPADATATVIVLDYAGGQLKPKNDDPRMVIRADGSVTLGDRYRENARIEARITKDDLQSLLRLAIDTNDFFEINAAEIEKSIAAKVKRENEKLAGQGIAMGPNAIMDDATTIVRIHADGKDHEVRLYGLRRKSRFLRNDERLTQLQNIVTRLEEVQRTLRAGAAKAKPEAATE